MMHSFFLYASLHAMQRPAVRREARREGELCRSDGRDVTENSEEGWQKVQDNLTQGMFDTR